MKRRRNQSGFTLIEMLTVIAIVGIMLSVGITALRYMLPSSYLNTTGRRLASFIEDARDEAVISGRTVYVDWDLGDGKQRQSFRSLFQPDPDDEVDEDEMDFEESARLMLTDWTLLDREVRIRKLFIGDEEEVEDGQYRIEIYPDGSMQNYILQLWQPETDAIGSIQVSGLLGTATFSLDEVIPRVLTEDTF